jgi:hypothetical protein
LRKKLRFWAGAAFGAAIQYLYDPKAGQARRALLQQKITDRVLDATDGLAANGATVGRIDHLGLRRMEPRRSASRVM